MNFSSDLSARAPAHQNKTQSRTVGMFLQRNDYDRMVMVPFLGFSSNPAKLDRCVKKVKAQGGAKNAWAVCKSSMKHG